MNALRTSKTLTSIASRRFASMAHPMPKQPVPECYTNRNFRTDFLSDPSTYPIIAVLGCTCCLILGMSLNTLTNVNKDIRITPQYKQQEMRTWGSEYREPLTHKLAMGPIIMHEKDYRATWQEGLGVDHNEWVKRKEAAYKALQE